MPTIVNGYTDIPKARARLRLTSAEGEDQLADWITVASRAIDIEAGRRFFAASETRLYTPTDADALEVDDLLSVTTLKTDAGGDRVYETTWDAATDYYLTPTNAALDGRPYTGVAVDLINGRYRFPVAPRSVQIVGSFGYAATVPPTIAEATLRLVARLAAASKSPQNVIATPEAALVELRADPDIVKLLSGYDRPWVFA